MNLSTCCKPKIIQTLMLLIVVTGCKRVEPPEDIKVNPNPSQQYLVTMQFDDDLSEIHDVKAIYLYSVSNIQACSPYAGFQVGGGWISIDKRISTKMASKSHNTYQSIYHPRYLLDEPYYSMAICKWKGQHAAYEFFKNDVLYSVVLSEEDIINSAEIVVQCEIFKKNKVENISETCRAFEPSELRMMKSYFQFTINSMEYKK